MAVTGVTIDYDAEPARRRMDVLRVGCEFDKAGHLLTLIPLTGFFSHGENRIRHH
jgi:hypothetical protein